MPYAVEHTRYPLVDENWTNTASYLSSMNSNFPWKCRSASCSTGRFLRELPWMEYPLSIMLMLSRMNSRGKIPPHRHSLVEEKSNCIFCKDSEDSECYTCGLPLSLTERRTAEWTRHILPLPRSWKMVNAMIRVCRARFLTL